MSSTSLVTTYKCGSELEEHFSPVTGAWIEDYVPIKLYVYDFKPYSYGLLNPLVKAKCFQDPRFREGHHLFRIVSAPDVADFLVFPCDLNYFEHRESEVLPLLPYFDGRQHRHVFFDHRDTADGDMFEPCVNFKVSLRRRDVSERRICIPYVEMVDNFFLESQRARRRAYEVCFIGERTPEREKLVSSLRKLCPSSFFELRDGCFHEGLLEYDIERALGRRAHDPVAARKRFIDTMRSSRFVLAPRGYGLNSFRFFEALSLGVPPLLVSDDCALPWEDLIDYDQITIRITPNDWSCGACVVDAMARVDEARYKEMKALGRPIFDAYLSARNYLFLIYRQLVRLLEEG